mgnify:FL=1
MVDMKDGSSLCEWWLQLIWLMATVDVNDVYSSKLQWMFASVDMNDGYSWCEWWL